MAKKLIIRKTKEAATLSEGDKAKAFDLITNATITRSSLLNKLIDPRRDIDDECGYPKEITTDQYQLMYSREGVAKKVVNLFPEECWNEDPEISENEEPQDTPFEEAWKTLEKDRQMFSYMFKIDEISGIGRFGIMLLGFADGKDLSQPVEGINERGERVGTPVQELLFVRVFGESQVSIEATEKEITNPRYGKPTMYSVTFENLSGRKPTGEAGQVVGKEQLVHWSRAIHIADNRGSSEVYGTPRMESLFNRLYDLRKITGGSAEMFWKGGFPGYSFEMDPNARPLTETQLETLRGTVADYANGLQRYLTVQGVSVKSLDPQVADPKAHVEVQLEMIAIAMGVPKRIFMGSEQAKLASSQDSQNWNRRVSRRQNKYLTPYVVRPVIERLILVGVLPEPEEFNVQWPDMDAPSDKDKAEVLKALVEAWSKYVGGNVDMLIPPEIFFKMFMGLDEEEIKEIMKQAEERQDEFEKEDAELQASTAEEEAQAQIEAQAREDQIRKEDGNLARELRS